MQTKQYNKRSAIAKAAFFCAAIAVQLFSMDNARAADGNTCQPVTKDCVCPQGKACITIKNSGNTQYTLFNVTNCDIKQVSSNSAYVGGKCGYIAPDGFGESPYSIAIQSEGYSRGTQPITALYFEKNGLEYIVWAAVTATTNKGNVIVVAGDAISAMDTDKANLVENKAKGSIVTDTTTSTSGEDVISAVVINDLKATLEVYNEGNYPHLKITTPDGGNTVHYRLPTPIGSFTGSTGNENQNQGNRLPQGPQINVGDNITIPAPMMGMMKKGESGIKFEKEKGRTYRQVCSGGGCSQKQRVY